MTENPLIRMLVTVVLIAAGIRIIFELLAPVWQFLLAAIVIFTLLRLLRWYRDLC